MALTKLGQDAIVRGAGAARVVLDQLKPVLDSLNVVYDSAGGLKVTITQQDLDEAANLSGLTKQQLDDGMFALTSTLRVAINNAYTQLAQLAVRG